MTDAHILYQQRPASSQQAIHQEILFFDDFKHEDGNVVHWDHIKFDHPVYLEQIRVVPRGAKVALKNGTFRIGQTFPKKFKLEFYARDLNRRDDECASLDKIGSIMFNSSDNESNGEDDFVTRPRSMPLDWLVIVGAYSWLTVALVGVKAKQTAPAAPPVAQQQHQSMVQPHFFQNQPPPVITPMNPMSQPPGQMNNVYMQPPQPGMRPPQPQSMLPPSNMSLIPHQPSISPKSAPPQPSASLMDLNFQSQQQPNRFNTMPPLSMPPPPLQSGHRPPLLNYPQTNFNQIQSSPNSRPQNTRLPFNKYQNPPPSQSQPPPKMQQTNETNGEHKASDVELTKEPKAPSDEEAAASSSLLDALLNEELNDLKDLKAMLSAKAEDSAAESAEQNGNRAWSPDSIDLKSIRNPVFSPYEQLKLARSRPRAENDDQAASKLDYFLDNTRFAGLFDPKSKQPLDALLGTKKVLSILEELLFELNKSFALGDLRLFDGLFTANSNELEGNHRFRLLVDIVIHLLGREASSSVDALHGSLIVRQLTLAFGLAAFMFDNLDPVAMSARLIDRNIQTHLLDLYEFGLENGADEKVPLSEPMRLRCLKLLETSLSFKYGLDRFLGQDFAKQASVHASDGNYARLINLFLNAGRSSCFKLSSRSTHVFVRILSKIALYDKLNELAAKCSAELLRQESCGALDVDSVNRMLEKLYTYCSRCFQQAADVQASRVHLAPDEPAESDGEHHEPLNKSSETLSLDESRRSSRRPSSPRARDLYLNYYVELGSRLEASGGSMPIQTVFSNCNNRSASSQYVVSCSTPAAFAQSLVHVETPAYPLKTAQLYRLIDDQGAFKYLLLLWSYLNRAASDVDVKARTRFNEIFDSFCRSLVFPSCFNGWTMIGVDYLLNKPKLAKIFVGLGELDAKRSEPTSLLRDSFQVFAIFADLLGNLEKLLVLLVQPATTTKASDHDFMTIILNTANRLQDLCILLNTHLESSHANSTISIVNKLLCWPDGNLTNRYVECLLKWLEVHVNETVLDGQLAELDEDGRRTFETLRRYSLNSIVELFHLLCGLNENWSIVSPSLRRLSVKYLQVVDEKASAAESKSGGDEEPPAPGKSLKYEEITLLKRLSTCIAKLITESKWCNSLGSDECIQINLVEKLRSIQMTIEPLLVRPNSTGKLLNEIVRSSIDMSVLSKTLPPSDAPGSTRFLSALSNLALAFESVESSPETKLAYTSALIDMFNANVDKYLGKQMLKLIAKGNNAIRPLQSASDINYLRSLTTILRLFSNMIEPESRAERRHLFSAIDALNDGLGESRRFGRKQIVGHLISRDFGKSLLDLLAKLNGYFFYVIAAERFENEDVLAWLAASIQQPAKFNVQPVLSLESMDEFLELLELVVSLVKVILQNKIKYLMSEFKDLSALPTLFRFYTVLKLAFQAPIEAAAAASQTDAAGLVEKLSERAFNIRSSLIDALMSFSQPFVDKSSPDALSCSLYTCLYRELARYACQSPFNYLTGLNLLAELLPLPARPGSPDEAAQRQVLAMHLKPLLISAKSEAALDIYDSAKLFAAPATTSTASTLVWLVRLFSQSDESSRVSQLFKCACAQIASLSDESAGLVVKCVVDYASSLFYRLRRLKERIDESNPRLKRPLAERSDNSAMYDLADGLAEEEASERRMNGLDDEAVKSDAKEENGEDDEPPTKRQRHQSFGLVNGDETVDQDTVKSEAKTNDSIDALTADVAAQLAKTAENPARPAPSNPAATAKTVESVENLKHDFKMYSNNFIRALKFLTSIITSSKTNVLLREHTERFQSAFASLMNQRPYLKFLVDGLESALQAGSSVSAPGTAGKESIYNGMGGGVKLSYSANEIYEDVNQASPDLAAMSVEGVESTGAAGEADFGDVTQLGRVHEAIWKLVLAVLSDNASFLVANDQLYPRSDESTSALNLTHRLVQSLGSQMNSTKFTESPSAVHCMDALLLLLQYSIEPEESASLKGLVSLPLLERTVLKRRGNLLCSIAEKLDIAAFELDSKLYFDMVFRLSLVLRLVLEKLDQFCASSSSSSSSAAEAATSHAAKLAGLLAEWPAPSAELNSQRHPLVSLVDLVEDIQLNSSDFKDEIDRCLASLKWSLGFLNSEAGKPASRGDETETTIDALLSAHGLEIARETHGSEASLSEWAARLTGSAFFYTGESEASEAASEAAFETGFASKTDVFNFYFGESGRDSASVKMKDLFGKLLKELSSQRAEHQDASQSQQAQSEETGVASEAAFALDQAASKTAEDLTSNMPSSKPSKMADIINTKSNVKYVAPMRGGVHSSGRGGSASAGSLLPGTMRHDTFRSRAPNTSRPPSMHVDDFNRREAEIKKNQHHQPLLPSPMGSGGGQMMHSPMVDPQSAFNPGQGLIQQSPVAFRDPKFSFERRSNSAGHLFDPNMMQMGGNDMSMAAMNSGMMGAAPNEIYISVGGDGQPQPGPMYADEHGRLSALSPMQQQQVKQQQDMYLASQSAPPGFLSQQPPPQTMQMMPPPPMQFSQQPMHAMPGQMVQQARFQGQGRGTPNLRGRGGGYRMPEPLFPRPPQYQQ